ncbi:flagellar basal body P-ring protein FlgI [Pigmentiphaga sp.]|uniref:flagellar basal body P-ring protein FlgI n=1 Tax=Pigmentiphaga sp. TaxID=1977564 RepID=UPI0025F1A12E|nr:flagellar basal body P-ring protein FlgI [Pigmentiphaga sp.]
MDCRFRFRFCIIRFLVLASCAWLPFTPVAQAARVKDLATVQGVRNNQLVGYGLVVGLDGTGDQTTQTPFTTQSLMSMLSNLGINVPPGTRLQLKNVAAVMVTATLPPFAQPGQQLDVTVSSMGNAKSLRGGTLLMTPLKGLDGQVYAIAQGSVSVGGAGASAAGSRTQVNHLSAGRIPSGATVEREVPTPFSDDGVLRLELTTADFSTARAMADAINRNFGAGTATALDGRVIELRAPSLPDERVAFMAQVENLEVAGSRAPARVVINARTGSVVMNQSVRLAPVAVAHGNLSVSVSATPVISQPAPFSGGQTVVTQRADIEVKQAGGQIVHLDGGAQLADVVKALNMLGATPQDLISILQALKTAGALTAELEII